MSIESIIRNCNKQAMECLFSNNYSQCYNMLKRAEEIIKSPNFPSNSKLASVTWNNLGCYYKRINSFDQSLEYLNKALSEDAEGDTSTLAGTHLNIQAVYSQLNNHRQAIFHGVQAIKLLKSSNNIPTLIIALQNTAEEYSMLNEQEKAFSTYFHALEIAQDHFGSNSKQVAEIQQKISALKKKDKKFYFEKLNKRAKKQIMNNIRTNSLFPTLNGPIKPSKSFEKSPPTRQKIGKKLRSDRVYSKTAPNNKQKMLFPAEKFRGQNENYIKLEEKINLLQNQLENFEVRYKKLESYAKNTAKSKGFKRKKKLGKEESAIIIQKWWRGYRDRKDFRVYKRKMTHERAKRAIQELEILRKEAIRDDLYSVEPRPKTNAPDMYRPYLII